MTDPLTDKDTNCSPGYGVFAPVRMVAFFNKEEAEEDDRSQAAALPLSATSSVAEVVTEEEEEMEEAEREMQRVVPGVVGDRDPKPSYSDACHQEPPTPRLPICKPELLEVKIEPPERNTKPSK